MLLALLHDLGVDFCDMYEGAWHALLSSEADSLRQAAHSARELIDWTLRYLAPNSKFTAEEIAHYGHNGQPTRRMRARLILNQHSDDAAYVDAMAEAVVRVHGRLVAVAHSGTDRPVRLRGLLRGCDSVLLILLGGREQQ